MNRSALRPYLGRLPKWAKVLLLRLRIGDCLIEFCEECGVEQPLDWWCRNTSIWTDLNGSVNGALCPRCFSARAVRAGYLIRWYPEFIGLMPIQEPEPAAELLRQRNEIKPARFKLRRLHRDAVNPNYAHGIQEDAGLDLHSVMDVTISPGARLAVPTGIAIELPPGFEAQIRPRSGLAAKLGITVLNSPATIDPGYRGEIKVILINLGEETITMKAGERIAQMVIARYEAVEWVEHDELSESARGQGGFGSSGAGIRLWRALDPDGVPYPTGTTTNPDAMKFFAAQENVSGIEISDDGGKTWTRQE